jgi:hypothetical protein
VNSVTLTTGVVAVNSAWGTLELHCGSPSAPCLRWLANVTIPPGFTGTFQWVQVAYPNRRRKLTSTILWEQAIQSGNDGGVPYPGDNDSLGTALNSDYLEKEDGGQRESTFNIRGPRDDGRRW